MVRPKIVIMETECPFCGTREERRISWTDFIEWQAEGKHIQDVFPYETDDERELLISGTCYNCQDEYFDGVDTWEEMDGDWND